MKCPDCQSDLVTSSNFSPWCGNCEWGLEEKGTTDSRDEPTGWYANAGHRGGLSLLKEVMVSSSLGSLEPRKTMANLLGLILSTLVFFGAAALVATGSYMIFQAWETPALAIWGSVLIALGALARPRIPRRPNGCEPINNFPVLKRVVDRIALSLEVRSVDNVVITEEFNAWAYSAGIRRTPYLGIGLPLWVALSPEEQVALISHELAHFRNNDPARALIPYSALSTLSEWRSMFDYDDDEDADIWTVLGRLPFEFISYVITGYQHLLLLCYYRESQRAEFLADYLESRVSGSANSISLMKTLTYGRYLPRVAERTYFNGDHVGTTLIPKFAEFLKKLPESERDRMSRLALRENARVDSTHPPTSHRIAFLEHIPAPAKVVMSQDEYHEILKELEPRIARMGSRLMAQFVDD